MIPPTPPPQAAPPPVAGPIDRESFFDAQHRHRRAAALLTLPLGFAMMLVGIPLAAVLFPFFFAAASVTLDVMGVVLPTPDLFGAFMATNGDFMEPEWLPWTALVVCAPGVLAMLLAWSAVWRVFGDAAAQGFALRLGARPPRPDDLEERQLCNVVEEMAIAAGVPAPTVLVVDTPAVNAAALGVSAERATVLVTRGVLDGMDRDETQAVVAHLVALIANGDTRATMRMVSAFATIGLVRKALGAPLDPARRRRLAELVGYALRRGGRPDPVAEAALVEALLREERSTAPDPGQSRWVYVLLPFMLTGATFAFVALLTNWLFLTPTLVPLLRRRRHLADATAVQLTRNPDALRRALGRLGGQPTIGFPAGGVTDLLFVARPASGDGDESTFLLELHPPISRRHQRVMALGDGAARSSAPLGSRLVLATLFALLAPLVVATAALMLVLIPMLTGITLIVGMMYAMVVAGLASWALR